MILLSYQGSKLIGAPKVCFKLYLTPLTFHETFLNAELTCNHRDTTKGHKTIFITVDLMCNVRQHCGSTVMTLTFSDSLPDTDHFQQFPEFPLQQKPRYLGQKSSLSSHVDRCAVQLRASILDLLVSVAVYVSQEVLVHRF